MHRMAGNSPTVIQFPDASHGTPPKRVNGLARPLSLDELAKTLGVTGAQVSFMVDIGALMPRRCFRYEGGHVGFFDFWSCFQAVLLQRICDEIDDFNFSETIVNEIISNLQADDEFETPAGDTVHDALCSEVRAVLFSHGVSECFTEGSLTIIALDFFNMSMRFEDTRPEVSCLLYAPYAVHLSNL